MRKCLVFFIAILVFVPMAESRTTIPPMSELVRRLRAGNSVEIVQGSMRCMTILKNGEAEEAIAQMLDDIKSSGGKDDFFQICAARVLWGTDSFANIPQMVKLLKDSPLQANYYYAFETAYLAAQTQDPRVLPILDIFLGCKEGIVEKYNGIEEVKWPLAHQIIWGTYGLKGLEHLHKNLNKYSDTQKESALIILGDACYARAMDDIRKIAVSKTEKPETRRAAVRALGYFGHPADYETIVAGINSNDAEDVYTSLYAIFEYGDLRAAPAVLKKVTDSNPRVRDEALSVICEEMTTLDAVKYIRSEAARSQDPKIAEEYKTALTLMYKRIGVTEQQFWEIPEPRLVEFFKRMPAQKNNYFSQLAEQDIFLERAHLEMLLKEWKEELAWRKTRFSWARSAHIINAATPADVPALYDVRAKLLTQLSPQTLGEVNAIEAIIKHLERTAYRKEPGVTERVEAPGTK